jgi:hypothetical protein
MAGHKSVDAEGAEVKKREVAKGNRLLRCGATKSSEKVKGKRSK